jgi:hypothetical protein
VSQPKLAALDTNILFHLAEQYAPAHNLIRRLVRNGFTPIVTQTVVQELGYCVDYGETARKREIAETALCSMREWGIQPVTLKAVGNGICDIAANVIASRGLLPESERHDAYILIESGFCGVALLLTWDEHLTGANNAGLNEVLSSFDLHPVQIAHPRTILGYEG